MRTTTYAELERAIVDQLGLNVDSATGNPNLQADEFHLVKRTVSRALADIWDAAWWPELMRVDKRYFRALYDSATAYAAGAEVFYVATGLYYVALRSTTGNAPATVSGGKYVANNAYWAEASRTYQAPDYDAATAYVAGNRVYYPATGRCYQCHTASTGNLPTATSYWGELIEFQPYVDLVQSGFTTIGRVKGVWNDDPRRFVGCRPVDFVRQNDRILLPSPPQNWVWVEYQLRVPRLIGGAYSASTAYTATPAESTRGSTVIISLGSGIGYGGRAALRARTQHLPDELAYLLYLVSDGDGQGGWFRFSASSSTTDDGVDTLKPDDITGAGRWIRVS